MEASEATPRVAVSAPDLSEVAQAQGPFVSLYMTTESKVENPAQRSEQRWKTLRNELAEAGAAEDALASIDPLVPDAHLSGDCLGVIASAEGVAHVEHGPDVPPRDVARWAPLPSLAPIIEWRQNAPPHVIVRTDRQGADLVAVLHEAADVHRQVEGDDDPIRKVAPGGWSQRRYQERAENTWEENAGEVAAELTRLVERVDARLVVAAGDVRALQLLEQELSKEIVEILRVVEGGGRAEDGSEEAFNVRVRDALSELVASESDALIRTFQQELGQSDRAADGVAATIEALGRAQVEVLLVSDVPDDDRTAWFGPGPTQLALDPQDLKSLGVDSPQEGRLVDALVRGALGTGAAVRVVPPVGGPSDGVGAILRWSS